MKQSLLFSSLCSLLLIGCGGGGGGTTDGIRPASHVMRVARREKAHAGSLHWLLFHAAAVHRRIGDWRLSACSGHQSNEDPCCSACCQSRLGLYGTFSSPKRSYRWRRRPLALVHRIERFILRQTTHKLPTNGSFWNPSDQPRCNTPPGGGVSCVGRLSSPSLDRHDR